MLFGSVASLAGSSSGFPWHPTAVMMYVSGSPATFCSLGLVIPAKAWHAGGTSNTWSVLLKEPCGLISRKKRRPFLHVVDASSEFHLLSLSSSLGSWQRPSLLLSRCFPWGPLRLPLCNSHGSPWAWPSIFFSESLKEPHVGLLSYWFHRLTPLLQNIF